MTWILSGPVVQRKGAPLRPLILQFRFCMDFPGRGVYPVFGFPDVCGQWCLLKQLGVPDFTRFAGLTVVWLLEHNIFLWL